MFRRLGHIDLLRLLRRSGGRGIFLTALLGLFGGQGDLFADVLHSAVAHILIDQAIGYFHVDLVDLFGREHTADV